MMPILDLNTAPHFIPQLAAWHHEQWSYLNPGRTAAQLQSQMQEYLGKHAIPKMLVLTEGSELLGSSSLITCDMDTRKDLSPWLANVYVSPDHRNKGLGKLLVTAVMDYAKQLKLEKIYLFTPDQERFYQSLGWNTLTIENYRGEDVTIMEWLVNA